MASWIGGWGQQEFHRGVVDGDDGPRRGRREAQHSVYLYSQLQIGNAVVSMGRFEHEKILCTVERYSSRKSRLGR
ncbi:hypothetical protein FCV25MIE_04047, partial [Fagus crenata]